MSDAATIARLNDAWRRSGTFMITAGVQALGADFAVRAIAAVQSFDDFTEDNDPYGEHDFGSLELDGHKLFWKIDYYAKAGEGQEPYTYGSEAPADTSQTDRVLTIMLAEEY